MEREKMIILKVLVNDCNSKLQFFLPCSFLFRSKICNEFHHVIDCPRFRKDIRKNLKIYELSPDIRHFLPERRSSQPRQRFAGLRQRPQKSNYVLTHIRGEKEFRLKVPIVGQQVWQFLETVLQSVLHAPVSIIGIETCIPMRQCPHLTVPY